MKTRLLLIAMFLLAPVAGEVSADTSAKSKPRLKLTLEEARKIALERVPGTIVEEELEKERGVWVYEFEIRPNPKKKAIKEVVIDANSGKVLEVEDEEEDDDREGDDDDDDGKDDD